MRATSEAIPGFKKRKEFHINLIKRGNTSLALQGQCRVTQLGHHTPCKRALYQLRQPSTNIEIYTRKYTVHTYFTLSLCVGLT